MKIQAAAVAFPLIATLAPASAAIEVFDLLPGYTLGGFEGLSGDGSTLAIDMLVFESLQYDAYAWQGGGWSSLPRIDRFNQWQGISNDGSITLSVSSDWGARPRLLRVENGERDYITFGTDDRQLDAAMTRDGQTVFYTMGGQASGPIDVYRYQANSFSSDRILTLRNQYSRVTDVIAGGVDDKFVVNTALNPVGTGNPSTSRALLIDNNGFFEIPTLSGSDQVQSRAVGMTADGSTIVGVEHPSTDFGSPDRSWMYRDGVLTEMTFDGFDHFSIQGIADDASAWIGSAYNLDGAGASFLIYESGRSLSASDLLASRGVSLDSDEIASFQSISGDGSVVAGVISRNEFDAFGPRFSVFTVSIPTPASGLLLLGFGLAARRRR